MIAEHSSIRDVVKHVFNGAMMALNACTHGRSSGFLIAQISAECSTDDLSLRYVRVVGLDDDRLIIDVPSEYGVGH